MSKFSLEKWEAKINPKDIRFSWMIEDKNGVEIALISTPFFRKEIARLIANAPDMYNTLTNLREDMKDLADLAEIEPCLKSYFEDILRNFEVLDRIDGEQETQK